MIDFRSDWILMDGLLRLRFVPKTGIPRDDDLVELIIQ